MAKMLTILEKFLNIQNLNYLRFDGTLKPDQRQYTIDKFNQDPHVTVFLASTRAGGIGINLTAASTVVFYDTDWNPSMDRQAMDRCHRLGQTRDVHVYRLISENSIEENIWRKQLHKRMLDDLVVDQGHFHSPDTSANPRDTSANPRDTSAPDADGQNTSGQITSSQNAASLEAAQFNSSYLGENDVKEILLYPEGQAGSDDLYITRVLHERPAGESEIVQHPPDPIESVLAAVEDKSDVLAEDTPDTQLSMELEFQAEVSGSEDKSAAVPSTHATEEEEEIASSSNLVELYVDPTTGFIQIPPIMEYAIRFLEEVCPTKAMEQEEASLFT